MAFLKENGGTLLVLAILIAIIALIIRSLIKGRSTGKGGCCGDCARCGGRCPSGVVMTVHIDGMVCAMCENHVSETLRRELRILQVYASHQKGVAVVRAAQPIPLSEFRRVLDPTGYRAVSVEMKP